MTKIEALKKTIYNLENDVYRYNWSSPKSCNCGILCASVMGEKFRSSEIGAIYTRSARCMITGLDMPEIFRVLKELGFSYQEIHELELLSNPRIANRAGITFNQFVTIDDVRINVGDFDDKDNVLSYLKAWVEILEEEKLNSEPLVKECDATNVDSSNEVGNIKTIIKYVSVPETISESLPETILS